jgi:Zn-dependent membrane protease YugP
MKKLFVIVLLTVFAISLNAQEKKSKTYEQHRSSKTGRYVTKSETKKSPSTTYTTKRKRK